MYMLKYEKRVHARSPLPCETDRAEPVHSALEASHACFGLCFYLPSLFQSGDCASFTFDFKFIEYLVHSFAPFYRF